MITNSIYRVFPRFKSLTWFYFAILLAPCDGSIPLIGSCDSFDFEIRCNINAQEISVSASVLKKAST